MAAKKKTTWPVPVFEPGQDVWFAENVLGPTETCPACGRSATPRHYRPRSIRVSWLRMDPSQDGIEIWYGDGDGWLLPSWGLYATEAEAQTEADLRNAAKETF